jgi:hypothetical protein
VNPLQQAELTRLIHYAALSSSSSSSSSVRPGFRPAIVAGGLERGPRLPGARIAGPAQKPLLHTQAGGVRRRGRKIREGLPNWSEPEILVALARLVASVGNAHTSINALAGSPAYPVRFDEFSGGLYVVAAAGENRDAIGARLMAVGGEPVDTAMKRLVPLIPMETPLMEKLYAPALLRNAWALGAAKTDFRLEKDGRQWTIVLEAMPEKSLPKLETAQFPTPLYLSDRASAYWFRFLGDSQTLYIQYNRCTEDRSRTFAEFTREAMAVADQHPVERLVIDLRHNSGGDSAVIKPLIAALKARPKLRRPGRVFVLVSRHTFSSGFMAELELKHEFQASIAGESSSQRANSYRGRAHLRVAQFQAGSPLLHQVLPVRSARRSRRRVTGYSL